VRERCGLDEEQVDLPADVVTIADLMRWQSSRGAAFEQVFAEPHKLRCAMDMEMATPDAQIGRANEIAFFPPVTGG
jgi:molybdopterin synthase sulfur carrier subunit